MRFGFCTNLVAKGPCRTGIEFIEKIAEFGYDYVELPIAEMTALPPDVFQEYKKRIEDSGLRCESCNNFFPASQRLTGPEVNDAKVEEYFNKALDRAYELGVKTIVFGSYAAKKVPDGFPMEKAYDQLLTLHKKVGEAARARDIMIAIEPTRTPLTNILITYAESVKFAKLVNDDNVKVLIDNYHMDAEKESPEIIREFPEYLRHIHFSNPNLDHPEIDRVVPEDYEEWNYAPLLGVLRDINYQGRVSVEAGCADFDASAPRAIKLLRKHFNW